VIFQIGADTYSYTGERRMALGNEAGLLREWDTQWGGESYRTEPVECTGRVPWVSLHDAVPRRAADDRGSWANRGVVIRCWNARLGGKQAAPWIAERGVRARGADTSTLDVVPPPGLTRLEPGDFRRSDDRTPGHPAVRRRLLRPQPGFARRAAPAPEHLAHGSSRGRRQRPPRRNRTGKLESLYPTVAIQTADGTQPSSR
jgi:hypothetical protein